MNSLILKTTSDFCTHNNLLKQGSTVIVGLSGGPDSVTLLHMLCQMKNEKKLEFIAAHLDHEWRKSSNADALWCEQLCHSLQIPFVKKKLSELSLETKNNGSLEALGRIARRTFFEQVARQYSADAIALGHHNDDQQETFFIRLLRGASLTGLTSIKPRDGLYIHPLLAISKSEILDFLHENQIAYLVDETNGSNLFLRNRIRGTVLPTLQATDERFSKNFNKTLARLQETEDFLNTYTQEIFDSLCTAVEQGYELNTKRFMGLHPMMQQRILMLWLCKHKVHFPVSHAFIQEIIRFVATGKQKKHALSHQWSLVRHNNTVGIIRE